MTPPKRSLRGLPAVEVLLRHPALADAGAELPRSLLVESIRAELALERVRLRSGSAVALAAGSWPRGPCSARSRRIVRGCAGC